MDLLIGLARNLLVILFAISAQFISISSAQSQDKQEYIINQLNKSWKLGLDSLNKGDYFKANQYFNKVNKLRLEGGFVSLEEYSLILLTEAERRLQEKDIDQSSFILKKALLFSPANPEILLKSLSTIHGTGLIPLSVQIANFAQNFARLPRFLIRSINNLIVPILWSLTIAAYLVCVLYCIYHFKSLCAAVQPYFNEKVNINYIPFIVTGMLIVPVFFGPIWCIVAWTLLVHISNQRKQLFSQLVAVLILSWGIMFPFSEGINNFLNHEGVKSIMRVTEGALSVIDYGRFRSIAEQKPNDPVIWFSYGQFLRKSGRLDEALKAFEKFDGIMPDRYETKLQLGLVYYLMGDSKKAKQLYEEVIQTGKIDPGISFNYSKILFDELSTIESQKFFKSAVEANSTLINDLRSQEDKIGRHALAEIGLPAREIMDWGLTFINFSDKRVLEISSKLALFGGPYFFMFLGTGMFLMAFIIKPRRGVQFIESLYHEYENPDILDGCFLAMPGGGELIEGETSQAFFEISIVSLFMLCLIGWPQFFSEGIYFIPYFHAVGAFTFMIIWLTFCYRGFSKVESILKWKI